MELRVGNSKTISIAEQLAAGRKTKIINPEAAPNERTKYSVVVGSVGDVAA